MSFGIDPITGALAHAKPERQNRNLAWLQRLATSAAGREAEAVLRTFSPASR
jgi:hypothetical protein